jgi:hypothetical protein
MRGHNPRLRWWACEPVAQLVEQRPFKPIEAFSTFPSVSSKKRTKPLQTLAFKPVSSLQRHARKCREMRRFWCQSYAKLRTRRARTGCVVCGRGGVVIVAYSVNVAIRRGRVVARLVIVPLARCTVKAPQVGHGCACTPRQRADDSPTDGARVSAVIVATALRWTRETASRPLLRTLAARLYASPACRRFTHRWRETVRISR